MNKSIANALLGLLTTTSFSLSLPFSANAAVTPAEPITSSVTGTTFPNSPTNEEQISQASEGQLVADVAEVCDYYYDYYGNIYYYCEYYVY